MIYNYDNWLFKFIICSIRIRLIRLEQPYGNSDIIFGFIMWWIFFSENIMWYICAFFLCARAHLTQFLTCRYFFQLLIQMHHSMFWTIQFWTWSITWYSWLTIHDLAPLLYFIVSITFFYCILQLVEILPSALVLCILRKLPPKRISVQYHPIR